MLFFKKKTVTEEKMDEDTNPEQIAPEEAPAERAPAPDLPGESPAQAEAAERDQPGQSGGGSFVSEEERSQLAEILGVTDAELKSEFILTKIRKLTAKIEYTFLKPDATKKELQAVAEKTKKYSFGKVCVLPAQVEAVKKMLPETVAVATIVGYPFGADSYGAALSAVRDAVKAGAREINFVIHPFKVKNDDFYDFRRRINKLCGAAKKRLVAVLEPEKTDRKTLKKLLNLLDRVPLAGVRLSSGYDRSDAGAQLAAYRAEGKNRFPVTVYTEVATAEELTKLFREGAEMVATNRAAEIALELAAVNHANFDS